MDSISDLSLANYMYNNAINGSKSPVLLPEIRLPVVDVSHFITSTSPDTDYSTTQLSKLRAALSSFGCVMIKNHGVETRRLDKVMSVFKQFVALPKQDKVEYEKEIEGFEGFGSDPLVTDVEVHDWCARLRLTLFPQHKRQFKYWPKHPRDFCKVVDEYSSKMQVLHDSILKATARSLNLEENTFTEMIGEERSISARFNWYPPCATPDRVLGLRQHSDATVITFLLQDKQVEGLQLLKDGQWYRVPIVPDALLLNVGDQLEIMSNGEFKSPIHRAVVNPEKERISLAVLSFPENDREIEPVQGLVTEERPRLYRKVKYNGITQLGYYLSGKRVTDEVRIESVVPSIALRCLH
ncbi:Codeine O-demethylase [Linum grandiflorum]